MERCNATYPVDRDVYQCDNDAYHCGYHEAALDAGGYVRWRDPRPEMGEPKHPDHKPHVPVGVVDREEIARDAGATWLPAHGVQIGDHNVQSNTWQ